MHDAMAEGKSEGEDGDDEGDGHEGAFEAAMGATIKMTFAKGNEFAKPHHRVRQTLGIAHQEVEHPAYYH